MRGPFDSSAWARTRILLLCVITTVLCTGQMCGNNGVIPAPTDDSPVYERVADDPVAHPQSSPAIEPGPGPTDMPGEPAPNEASEDPPAESALAETASDDGSGSTPPSDEPPPDPPIPPLMCHSGTFFCADGPDSADCGIWDFEINEADAIVGIADIHSDGLPAAAEVTLSGIVDPGAECVEVVLTTADGGYGAMRLCHDGPGLVLTGEWSFTSDAGPTGQTVSGTAEGASCEAWD